LPPTELRRITTPIPTPSTIGPFGSGATLKTDGEKIVGRVEAPAFKVGSVYRNKCGDVQRLSSGEYGKAWALRLIPTGEWIGDGWRFLASGIDTIHYNDGERDLLPGELVQRDGQWVAMEEATRHQPLSWKDARPRPRCRPS
jgi:hypothetical protein